MTSSPTPTATSGPAPAARWPAAVLCAVAGGAVFQAWGNANHGYIDTASLFWWWVFQWINPTSETQHGWLILGLSAWLLVRGVRRAGPPAAAMDGDRGRNGAPAAAMLGALALHAVGFATQQARISILALLLFAWGLLRLGGGPRWGKAAAFPLAFLVFAIPFNALDSVGFWLRLWVIDASAWLAHHAGIGVLQNGTLLVAPDGRYNYDVAAACSGIRSLMALAALSLLIGYLQFRTVSRRALVVASCFPLVYLGNVARISAIVFAAQLGGSRWGDVAHAVMGYGVFVIVLGGVLGVAALIERWWPEIPADVRGNGRAPAHVGAALSRDPAGDERHRGVKPLLQDDQKLQGGLSADDGGVGRPRPATASRPAELRGGRGRRCGAWGVAGVVLVAVVADSLWLNRLSTRPEAGAAGVLLAADQRNPVELPYVLGREWVGRPTPVTTVEREILPPDTGFSRLQYVSSRDGHAVLVSIVLSGRDRTSIHRPELCLVGQGWTLRGRSTHVFTYPGQSDASFPASLLHVERALAEGAHTKVVPQLVAYWFVDADSVVATHWSRMARDGWNRLLHGRADRWAYVLLQTDAVDGEEAAVSRLQSVLNAVLPAFQKPMPKRT